jgi:hypothetical protein
MHGKGGKDLGRDIGGDAKQKSGEKQDWDLDAGFHLFGQKQDKNNGRNDQHDNKLRLHQKSPERDGPLFGNPLSRCKHRACHNQQNEKEQSVTEVFYIFHTCLL